MDALAGPTFVLAVLLYAAASSLFYLDIARDRGHAPIVRRSGSCPPPAPVAPQGLVRWAPLFLGAAAAGHLAYVAFASLVVHVCPIRSVHFILSVASLFATATYLALRTRFRIDALGLLVSPLGLAFLLGTYFLGKPAPAPRLSPVFITLHVVANLLGVALFLLAGGAAALYLVQEKRLKTKRHMLSNLPPLDTLDRAEHRFLVAGFPLLTLGIVTGTYWAHKLEMGSVDDVMRTVFGYVTWMLIAGVLLLRAAAGWRGRRSAYGTLLGLLFATAVMVIYLVRPSATDAPRLGDTARAAATIVLGG